MSASGVEEVYHFTSENSPLLSNIVNNIEIDLIQEKCISEQVWFMFI